MTLLNVRDLHVTFDTEAGRIEAVRGCPSRWAANVSASSVKAGRARR
jgi:hypothetical protein